MSHHDETFGRDREREAQIETNQLRFLNDWCGDHTLAE